MSAIQSSRHFSCATSEQVQGDRHSDVVSSSSVSSLKQIQHFRGSSSSSELSDCGGASLCSSVTGVAARFGGELSKSVCESTDWAEKLFERAAWSCWEEDDSAGGEDLRCDAGCWGGRDAMLGVDGVEGLGLVGGDRCSFAGEGRRRVMCYIRIMGMREIACSSVSVTGRCCLARNLSIDYRNRKRDEEDVTSRFLRCQDPPRVGRGTSILTLRPDPHLQIKASVDVQEYKHHMSRSSCVAQVVVLHSRYAPLSSCSRQ